MNKHERKDVEKIKAQIEALKQDIEFHQQEEESKFENLPEGLKESFNGQRLEAIAGYLGEAIDALDNAISE